MDELETALPSDLRNYNRKSLFSGSRTILSLKNQVPMSQLRDILAGSGKNSENSTHYDMHSEGYFRANQRLGKTRNQVYAMTQKNLQPDNIMVQGQSEPDLEETNSH